MDIMREPTALIDMPVVYTPVNHIEVRKSPPTAMFYAQAIIVLNKYPDHFIALVSWRVYGPFGSIALLINQRPSVFRRNLPDYHS